MTHPKGELHHGLLRTFSTWYQQRQLHLVQIVANDLDVKTQRTLKDALLEFASCIAVISHYRWLLERITTLPLPPFRRMNTSGAMCYA